MTSRKFKDIFDSIMKDEAFLKQKNRYYISSPEIVCVVGLQKSNFSNFYYVNIGYFIHQLDPHLEIPREADGHIRTRMTFEDDLNKNVDYLDLDKLNEDDIQLIKDRIKENITKLIKRPLNITTLKKLLSDHPVLLYQTSKKAKSFLGYS